MKFRSSFRIVKIALLNLALLSNMYPTAEEVKESALELGQPACFFNTNGEDPFLTILDPSTRETKIVKCGYQDPETGKQSQIKKAEDLENLAALRLTVNGFGGNYKYDVQYRGARKSMVAETLAKVILPNKTYPGTVLVDEYKKNIPMFWVLKNVEELRAISVFMIKNLNESIIAEVTEENEELNIYKEETLNDSEGKEEALKTEEISSPEKEEIFVPKEKTLLILKIIDDKNLESLDETDKEFLNTYFEVFPLSDKDLKEFFQDRNQMLIDTGFNIGGSSPKSVGETISQGIFKDTERFFKDFDRKKIAILLGGYFTFKIAECLLADEWNAVKKRVQNFRKDHFEADSFLDAFISWCTGKPAPISKA